MFAVLFFWSLFISFARSSFSPPLFMPSSFLCSCCSLLVHVMPMLMYLSCVLSLCVQSLLGGVAFSFDFLYAESLCLVLSFILSCVSSVAHWPDGQKTEFVAGLNSFSFQSESKITCQKTYVDPSALFDRPYQGFLNPYPCIHGIDGHIRFEVQGLFGPSPPCHCPRLWSE